MMSLLIVSISEITPWVFSNSNAAENSVILDAACFDAVLSIPSEAIFAKDEEIVYESVQQTTETETEVLSEAVSVSASAAKIKKDAPKNRILISGDKLLWPVGHKSEVVSGFPYYENGGAHHGIDIFVIGLDGENRDENGKSLSYGKPFRAADSGVVVEVQNNSKWNTGFGNYCIIDHGNGTQTLYAHAKNVYVSLGDTVLQGQTIGEIGGTGNATAPHLHFEVRVDSFRVDPMDYVSEPTA